MADDADTNTGTSTETMSPDELRTLFLFEALDEEQLAELSRIGSLLSVPAGTVLYSEGEPARCFYVLVDGSLTLLRRVRGSDVVLNRTDYRGTYCGATAAFIDHDTARVYNSSVRISQDSRFFVLSADDFAGILNDWFPMAVHLLQGALLGIRNSQEVIGQRERLLALGQLSAGLTHELNNPAAAAVRATSALRERVTGMRHKLAMLASGQLETSNLRELVELQDETAERVAKSARRSVVEMADLEDELSDWLDGRGIPGGYDIAAIFAGAGLGTAWAEEVEEAVGAQANLRSAISWLAYTVETEQLMGEIEDATTRISTLLAAVGQYSGMDRTPYGDVDLAAGLSSTLTMMSRKIGPGVSVEKDFGPDVPAVPGYASELNQVWTNLIDNALGAMGGQGTLRVSTRVDGDPGPDRSGDRVIVTVADTGPGVPKELAQRIFEPFFTTKDVGEGTGLGLDISYRIVVQRHHGSLTLTSEPGDTRFIVTLPTVAVAPEG